MNKAILMGRLTRDPEVRYSQSAEPTAVVRFTVAVNRRFKRDGEQDADFIGCVAFGKTGEFIGRYFKKGSMISVAGRIQTGSYEKDGVKHYTTDVVAEEAYFCESKASADSFAQSMPSAPSPQPANMQTSVPQPSPAQPDGFYHVEDSIDDDDLPF